MASDRSSYFVDGFLEFFIRMDQNCIRSIRTADYSSFQVANFIRINADFYHSFTETPKDAAW